MIFLALPSLQTWVYILAIALIVMLIAIGYQKLIKKFSKDQLTLENYCVLHNLETDVATGKVDFYFTSQESRKVNFEILDENYQVLKVIYEQDCAQGGNIVPFDTQELENGNYFYCLRTYNQKTMKKVTIKN